MFYIIVGVIHITVGVFMLMGAFYITVGILHITVGVVMLMGAFYTTVGVYKFMWAFLY